MVAIFTGAGTGFERGSGSVLGAAGLLGSSTLGRGGEQLFLNAATGNLLISQSDEFLVGLGPDVSISRTYNSLGDLSDENADNWRQSTQRRIVNLTGTLNAAGSTVQRVGADGATITYTWDATKSAYVETDGVGAYDTLTSSGGVWTWKDGDSQITETYGLEYGSSTSWRITSQTDTDGNALSFTYVASSNHLDKVTTQDGSYVQYSWSGNNITQILTGYTDDFTDYAHPVAKTLTRTRYAYDGSNRLSSVTVDLSPGDNSIADGAVYTTTYTYDGTSTRVASISQSDGSRVDITYDGSNRVATLAQTTATGVTRSTTLTYGSGYTTITDQAGQIVRMDYDAANNLTKITMPPAVTGASPQITQFAYDTSGNVTSVTDALSNATTYTNFVNGNWQTATDRLGNVTTRTYGSKNELLTETTTSSDAASSAAAHTTRYAYDSENHLRYRISAEGYVTSYSYHPEGQVWGTVDYAENFYDVSGLSPTTALTEAQMNTWASGVPDGSSIKYIESGFDSRGNLTGVSRYSFTAASGIDFGEGAPQTVTYRDQAGNIVWRFQGGRSWEHFVYDGLGRLTSAVDVNGGTTSYVFDDANSKTIATFASGLVQTSTYNKAGELISFMETGATTALAAVTGTATYGYDQLGQLRWNVDATGKKTYHLYDNVGRKVADISSAGEVSEYKYDADNRLIATVRYANTNSGTLTNLDNLTGAADIATYRPTSSSSDLWTWNIYDKEGRLLQAIDGLGWTSTYEYDGAGRLIKSTSYFNNVATSLVTGFKTAPPTAVTLPPADAAHDAVTRTFYDKDGRLVGTLDGEGFVTKAVYDKAGFKVEEFAYTNVSLAADRASGTFSTILSHISADAANDRHTRYVYNGLGQLRFVIDSNYQVTEMRYAVGDGQATTTIRYANAISSSTTDFGWDNLKALVAAGGFASPTNDRTSYAVYDWPGNLVYAIDGEGGVTRFSYNTAGQLIKSTQYAAIRSTTSLPDQATMDSWAAANANGANDRVTRNYYDGAGVLRYVVDGEGFVTRRTEDAEGRLTLVERFANAATATDSTTIDTLHAWVIASGGVSANTTTAYDVDGRVSTVTDGEGNVTRSVYNINGTLQSQTVADGTPDASTTYFVYDGAGRVTEQHRAYGTSAVSITRYGYDGLGNVLTVTDPDNHVTTQTFDRLGQQLTSTNALSGVTSFVYNAFGQAVQTTDPNGNVSFNYYNALGQLTKSCDALKYVTETNYNVFGEVASVTRRYNAATNTPSITVQPTVTPDATHDATTSFLYDRLGRLTKSTDAQGYYEQYTLNAFGNRVQIAKKSNTAVIAAGGTITNSYDRRGLLVSEVLPMASVNNAGTQVAATVTNKFAYDARGNRTQMIEAFGLAEARTTNYAYDKIDRLITKTSDAVTTVAYSDFTSTTAVTVTTTSSVVPTEAYVYDKRGNLIQVTDANGAKTLSYYDKIGRKTGEVGPLGTLKAWTYDAAGNMLTERVYGDVVAIPGTPGGSPPNPINGSNYRETVYAYDVLNRLSTSSVASVLVGTWDAVNLGVSRSTVTVSSTLAYDANGNVITSTDANGGIVYSYYDKLGHKTAQLDQEGYLTSWTYDSEGNVLSERRYATKWTGSVNTSAPPAVATDATNDRVTNFTYDRNGHRLTETRTGVVAWTVSSSNGALTAASTNSVVTYTYNGLGQVLTKAEATGDAVAYVYDATGRLTKETRATYADQTSANVTPEVLYSYNGLNNLSRTQQGEKTAIEANAAVGRITTYLYGAGGRLASMTDPAGGAHNYLYDAAGNLVQDGYTRTKSDATTVNEAILYRRDLLGRIITQTIATNAAGVWTRGDSQNTQYDAYGEVSQRGVNGLWQESFTYNNRGLVEKTNTGDGVWRFFVYDKAGNQVLAIEPAGTKDYTSSTLAQALTDVGTYGTSYLANVTATITVYDKRSQVVQVRMPQRELAAGAPSRVTIATSQTYNAFGEIATQTDGRGYTTALSYNTMGRVTQKLMPQVSVTSAAGVVSNVNPTENYYYDLSGRLVAKQDANGNTISQTLLAGAGYGGSDTLTTAEYHPDGGIKKTFYDVFGDARTLRNELNVDETRTYDNMGRVLTVTHRGIMVNNTTNYQLVDNYTYDLLGQRLTHWNSALGSSVKETTDYDLQGRIVSAKDFAGDTTAYQYAWQSGLINPGLAWAVVVGGWLKTTTHWSGTAYSKQESETADIHGLTITETDFGGHVTNDNYDRAGRLTKITAGSTTQDYYYFNTGLVATIVDTAGSLMNTITAQYDYDANGNHIKETYSGTVYKSQASDWSQLLAQTGYLLQAADIIYDALGRMTYFGTNTAKGVVQFNQYYDAAGNIRHTSSSYPNILGSGFNTKDEWFAYDSMNRMTVANGILSGGTVTIGTNANGTGDTMGRSLTYDVAGNRHTSTKQFLFHDLEFNTYETDWETETYTFDNEGNLTAEYDDWTGNNAITYRDNQGRVSSYVEKDVLGNVLLNRYGIVYNARGQVTYEETSQKKNDAHTYLNKTTNTYDGGAAGPGNQTLIVSHNYKDGVDSGALDTSMTQTYAWYDDGTMATQTYDYDTGSSNTLYTSTYYYDGLGRLQRTKIQDGRPRYIHFALDSNGQILSRVMNQANTDDTQDYHFFAGGRQVGEYSDNAGSDPTNLNYSKSVDNHKSVAGTGDFRNGAATGTMGSEMGTTTYDPTNPVTAGTSVATSSGYTVRSGDTLQGIAAGLWGDSSLWYLIADANGISGDTMLAAGQSLRVPFKGPSSANNASTFKPYDAAHATGDLAPTSPKPPKKNKCGMLGQILLIAVVVAATIVLTAGVASLASGAAFSSSFGAVTSGSLVGLGATATSAGLSAAGAIGVAAVGGALGSIVGQGIGVATGLQDKFSWKGVALAGLTAGITQGVGGSGLFKGVKSPVLRAGLNGATSNAIVQGIGVVTGLQDRFDWAGVAAAGVGAAAGRAVSGVNGFSSLGKFGERLVTNMAGGIANAATRSLINGSDFGDNVMAALPDIIGQTLGGSLADSLAGRPTTSAAPGTSSGSAKDMAAQFRAVRLADGNVQVTTPSGDVLSGTPSEVAAKILAYYPGLAPSGGGGAIDAIAGEFKSGLASIPYDSSGTGKLYQFVYQNGVYGADGAQVFGQWATTFGGAPTGNQLAGEVQHDSNYVIGLAQYSEVAAMAAPQYAGQLQAVANALYQDYADNLPIVVTASRSRASSDYSGHSAYSGSINLNGEGYGAICYLPGRYPGPVLTNPPDRLAMYNRRQDQLAWAKIEMTEDNFFAAVSGGVAESAGADNEHVVASMRVGAAVGDVFLIGAAAKASPNLAVGAPNLPWPTNEGFVSRSNMVLEPGTLLDRYGRDAGVYLSPLGTPIEMRSLKPGTPLSYSSFEVLRPLPVVGGPAKPAFGDPGMGMQYKAPQSIAQLLAGPDPILRRR